MAVCAYRKKLRPFLDNTLTTCPDCDGLNVTQTSTWGVDGIASR